MSNLDKFKEYIKSHPGLKKDVLNHKMTWQEIYENWTLSVDDPYSDYKSVINDEIKKEGLEEIKENKNDKKEESTEDMVKNILGYMKKINPDNVTKYVTSIQKVLELLASFGAGATASAASKKNTTDPLFDRRYDDWY